MARSLLQGEQAVREMKIVKAMFGGVIGAVTISVITAGLRAAGCPIDFELTLGSIFTRAIGFSTWLLGLALHLGLGALFALLYAAVFEYVLLRASWALGVLVSVAHVALAGVVLAASSSVHPLMPHVLPAPGPLMLSFGWFGVLSFLALHLMYGAIVGGFYGATRVTRSEQTGDAARFSLNP